MPQRHRPEGDHHPSTSTPSGTSSLLRLDGVNVEFVPTMIAITITLRCRRPVCPHSGFTGEARYDLRPEASAWRHLDLGVWRVEGRAIPRRSRCPTQGVVVEGVRSNPERA